LKEIGNLLRQAREEKGKSLDEISRETKIQKRYLSLLEEGDFSSFSGEVYLKGALRNFAEAVGLNSSEIILLYDQAIKAKKTIEEKKEKEKEKKDKTSPVIGKEKKALPIAALAWLIVLVFVVGGSIWYRYQQGLKNEGKIPYTNGIAEEEPEESPEKTNNNGAVPVEQPEKERKLTLASSEGNEIVYILSGVEQKEITLTFTGRCWVRIEQEGKLVEENNYNAGETKSIGDSRETWIRLGNPPVVRIKVNGFEIKNLTGFSNPVNITIKKEG
jgi:cytoskeletal protein RodZ